MIIRREGRQRYTSISNAAIEDERLSFRALGMLTYLLSRPDGWSANYRQLQASHTEGQHAVLATLKELEGAGYLERRRVRLEGGRFGWECVIREEPGTGSPCVGNPPTAKPGTARSRSSKNSTANTEQQSSSSSARVQQDGGGEDGDDDDDDAFEAAVSLVVDARCEGRQVKNQRAYRAAVRREAIELDGQMIRDLLAAGSSPLAAARTVLGHGESVASHRGSVPWCDPGCRTCGGDAWVEHPNGTGLVPCPERLTGDAA